MGSPLRDRRPLAELAERRQVIEIDEKVSGFQRLAGIVEADLAAKLEEAEAKIAETKAQALASIKDVANDTAAAVVEHLLGEGADSAAIQAAVDAELAGREG